MDEVLNKFGELLKRIVSDERFFRDVSSDIESVNIDILINMNLGVVVYKKGYVYFYKNFRNRLKIVGVVF